MGEKVDRSESQRPLSPCFVPGYGGGASVSERRISVLASWPNVPDWREVLESVSRLLFLLNRNMQTRRSRVVATIARGTRGRYVDCPDQARGAIRKVDSASRRN